MIERYQNAPPPMVYTRAMHACMHNYGTIVCSHLNESQESSAPGGPILYFLFYQRPINAYDEDEGLMVYERDNGASDFNTADDKQWVVGHN